jgi:adenylate cyclase
MRRKRPENHDAYDLYLQALPPRTGGSVRVEDYDKQIDLLHRSITLDPKFAQALAWCAWAHEKRLTRGGSAPPGVDDAREALELAERAMAADSADALVLLVAGVVRLTIAREDDAGFALIMRALAVNPNSLPIINTAGYAYYHRCDYDNAISCRTRALELISPGSPDGFWILSGIARAHLGAGRFEEALTWGLRAREATTALDFAYCVVAASYAHLGRLHEAREGVAAARAIWPELTITRLVGHYGQPRECDRLLAEGLRAAGLPEA